MEERFKEDKSNIGVDYIAVVRNTFRAYWPLYAIAVILFLGSAFLLLRYTSPTYRVTAKILVKDDKKTGVGGGASSLISEFDLFGGKKIVENELEILKSKPIIEKVVRETNCNIHVYRNGRIRDVLEGLDFPILFQPIFPDSIGNEEKVLSVEVKNEGLFVNGKTYPLSDTLILQDGKKAYHFRLLIDKKRINEIIGNDYYINTYSTSKEVKSILEKLELATTSKNTSVIQLIYETKNVQRGEEIIQLLIKSYTNAAIDDKRQIAEFTLRFIEDRLSLVSSQLDSVERDIETYKEANQIIDLSQQGRIFLESVKEQDVELNKINVQLSVVRDVEDYVNGKSMNPGNTPSLVGISDPSLNSLLNNLYELGFSYNKRKKGVGERDEQLMTLEEEIYKLRNNLKESVFSTRRNLEVTKRKIQDDLNVKMGSLTTLPGKERMLLDISRQQIIKNSIYTYLLEKREESAISFASTVSDVRIVEPSQGDEEPIRPTKKLVGGIALFLSLILPSIYIYYKEVLTGKIKFKTDIESRTALSVLGEVLQGEANADFIISSDNRSPVAEALRSVRSKMSYYLPGESSKVVLLSSCLPGEGKSFITTNLGLSLSLMGKRTLVIAADMRKPRLHKAFGVNANVGLSQILIGKLSWQEAIVKTEFENLDILPPGPIPPNPAELLLNGNYSKMIQSLRERYDFILVDTPPLGLISDAEIMASDADLSLFVVRHDHSLKEAVQKILGPIGEDSKFWPAAIVFNGLKTRGITKYGRSYGYGGYGLGYGYAYGDDKSSS